jgi:uncharacterized damage-inducible protein DinB
MIARPAPDEYAPFYGTYINALDGEDAVATLVEGMEGMTAVLATVPADREEYRYAPGKWSVREVVGHILDAERVFAVRALTFARGDAGPLPGFDEDGWAAHSNAGSRPLADLAKEFALVRGSNVSMARGFTDEALLRTGVASGKTVTVRALLWIMAAHEAHHRRLLAERYLGTTGD